MSEIKEQLEAQLVPLQEARREKLKEASDVEAELTVLRNEEYNLWSRIKNIECRIRYCNNPSQHDGKER